MMAIFEEVAAGSQGLIPNWQLLPNAQQALRDAGPEGLARFYRDCIEGAQGAAAAHLTCYLVWRQESEAWRLCAERSLR